MDPELEFQLRLAVSCSTERQHSAVFINNLLWLVVTLPPMLATAGYAGLRLLRWANEHPEQQYVRRLWLALWVCAFCVFATGMVLARVALKMILQP